MYCSNCGKQIPDNSMFCPECGEKVAQKAAMPKVAEAVTPSAGVAAFNAQRVKCPCCGGHNLQTVSEVTTVSSTTGGGYSGSKGCLGLLLFGPFGLLCGNCGNAQKTEVQNNTKFFWVCSDCGHKFEHLENIQKEIAELETLLKKQKNSIIVTPIVMIVLFILLMMAGISVSSMSFVFILFAAIEILGIFVYPSTKTKMEQKKQEYAELQRKTMD